MIALFLIIIGCLISISLVGCLISLVHTISICKKQKKEIKHEL